MSRFGTNRAVVSFCMLFASAVCIAHIGGAEIDFDTEVVPSLSKAGCNAASCHGGAAGQAGFRLSLFGGDPEFDYRTIVHELYGRRVNLLQPTDSLVVSKPTGQLQHGGGQVLDPDSELTKSLVNWIAEGCHRLQLRKVDRLEVVPGEFVADKVPVEIQLQVTAIFDDGLARDVTKQVVFVSQNESALVVDESGTVTVRSPGRHSVVVRFAGHVAIVSFTTPIGSNPVHDSKLLATNWVDDEVNETLKRLQLAPAARTGDASFLRRLSLDLVGRLPSLEQIEKFIRDDDTAKRSKMIERLLDSESFVEYWTHRLAIHLRLRKPGQDSVAADVFYRWLKRQIADDKGWDKIASSLLLSEGDSHVNGAATVHRFFATAREEAEYMSEVLMGVRLRCANCHNHPLDRWTQDDYHGLAAVFAGIERSQIVRFTGRGAVIHPRTGVNAVPRIPGGPSLNGGGDKRHELSEWLISEDNPYFAKAMVGRVWQTLMGRGLVTPVDDLRETNPASHPGLLGRLSNFFVENGFKLRPLIRLICNSAAYQRSSSSPGSGMIDDTGAFYSYAIVKPLSAEVLADAISDVTGVADDYRGVTRTINVVDRASSSSKLQFLGQCLPSENCSTPSDSARGIASKLHLMNGELLNVKIVERDGRLHRMLTSGMTTQDVVRELYLRALCRPPSDRELADWVVRIDAGNVAQQRDRFQDFFWALLNCHEFTHIQ